VWIELEVPRLGCRACGAVRQAEVSFAPGQQSYTQRFARYVVDLARCMTMWDVALHLGVSWNLVKTIVKEELRRRFRRPRLKDLRLLAIDEISVGRGHRYLTVVLDLESGAVVFVGGGKGSDALDPFWRRLRQSGAKVEAVAIDMSQAYIQAVKEHLPGAVLVFDHFHVVKLMNDKLSNLRRELPGRGGAEGGAQGNPVAPGEEPGEPEGGQRRSGPAQGSPGPERSLGCCLLPQGRSATILEGTP